jgi:methylated-DNA-[protein]-cysteine S-methyltransferase
MTKKIKVQSKVIKKVVSKTSLSPFPPNKETFRDLVYKLCRTVPKGSVTTYGEIAKALKKPNSARAVGNALRNNPYAPIVPCHRVIPSTRAIGGFFGQTSGPEIQRKIQMLKEESVTFDEDGKVSQGCIFKFA